MAIEFSYNFDDHYLLVKYIGKITDEMMLSSWKRFYDGIDKILGVNVLSDLSQADMSDVTISGIERLNDLNREFHAKHNIKSIKVANYALKDLSFGLARSYEGYGIGSVETIKSFKDINKATAWLKE